MLIKSCMMSAVLALAVHFLYSPHARAESDLERVKPFLNQVLELSEPGQNLGRRGPIVNLKLSADGERIEAIIGAHPYSTMYYGICFDSKKSCISNYTIKDAMSRIMARSVGRSSLHPTLQTQFASLPETYVITITTVQSASPDELILSFSYMIAGSLPTIHEVHLKKVEAYESIKVQLADLGHDQSRRSALSEVPTGLRNHASGIFKIISEDNSDQNLLGTGNGYGTGFFISEDGLALTNNHVINGVKGCLKNLSCDLSIERFLSDGRKEKKTLRAHLLATNEGYDVAVIQLELPSDFKKSYFLLEDSEIGPDLLTLGFPGDRVNHDLGPLTFSLGQLMGFEHATFATSAYIWSGASGSPLLSAKSGKLAGILSNGSGGEVHPGEGIPGIARPMPLVEKFFGLKDYISGRKQERVTAAVQSLRSALYADAAQRVLTRLRAEHTLIGIPELIKLMVKHPSVDVREEIQSYLKDVGFIGVN